jgi:hypothetical protein
MSSLDVFWWSADCEVGNICYVGAVEGCLTSKNIVPCAWASCKKKDYWWQTALQKFI